MFDTTATMGSSETVLLTGATGFVGSAVAAQLLEHYAGVQPLFLVRARDRHAGLDRLRTSLAKLDPPERVLERLSTDMVVCGCLATFPELLGDSRVKSVTRILNAAALASFAWKQDVWDVNVDETFAFASAVSRLPAVRRFLYVGTSMISGSVRNRLVQEDEFPNGVRQFVPYTESKAEMERRLPAALNGVPLVVGRPSIVVGHTRAGCRPSPSIFWIFRLINAAKRIPFPSSYAIDIVPVDYCARALMHLLLKEELLHCRYHVSAGEEASCTFSEIDKTYCAVRGLASTSELEAFDIADVAAMEDRFGEWFGPCDTKQIASAIRIYRAFGSLNVRFDNQRLINEGMEPPPRFVDYLAECVRTGEEKSISEQMRYDFR
jgi:nucleoside-diphosphate-sugar epimerase